MQRFAQSKILRGGVGLNKVASKFNKNAETRPVQRLSARAAAGEDPYKVLGIPRKADAEQIRRVYKKKIAEAKGNDEQTQRIEEAHTSIMMSSFSARISGGASSVDKNIAYADRAKFFPWRPRLHRADKKLITYAAAAHGLLATWAVFLRLTAGQQPLVAWLKNILRGIGLAVFATFIGCAMSFTVPDAIAAQFGQRLPFWFYESETTLITLGTAISNFIVNALYR